MAKDQNPKGQVSKSSFEKAMIGLQNLIALKEKTPINPITGPSLRDNDPNASLTVRAVPIGPTSENIGRVASNVSTSPQASPVYGFSKKSTADSGLPPNKPYDEYVLASLGKSFNENRFLQAYVSVMENLLTYNLNETVIVTGGKNSTPLVNISGVGGVLNPISDDDREARNNTKLDIVNKLTVTHDIDYLVLGSIKVSSGDTAEQREKIRTEIGLARASIRAQLYKSHQAYLITDAALSRIADHNWHTPKEAIENNAGQLYHEVVVDQTIGTTSINLIDKTRPEIDVDLEDLVSHARELSEDLDATARLNRRNSAVSDFYSTQRRQLEDCLPQSGNTYGTHTMEIDQSLLGRALALEAKFRNPDKPKPTDAVSPVDPVPPSPEYTEAPADSEPKPFDYSAHVNPTDVYKAPDAPNFQKDPIVTPTPLANFIAQTSNTQAGGIDAVVGNADEKYSALPSDFVAYVIEKTGYSEEKVQNTPRSELALYRSLYNELKEK